MKASVIFVNRKIEYIVDFKRGLKGEKGDQGDPATNLVQSVNGKQGVVVLDATDVGADTTGSASQALQDAKDYTDSEILNLAEVSRTGDYDDLLNKPTIPTVPVTSVNGEVGNVVLTSDDIADTATNRYTNDTDITRLANTSGTNTGDQDLTPYATNTALTNGLATKEPTITTGTTAQYWRGDKTWQPTLDMPISTATQTALDGKATKLNIAQYQAPVRIASGVGEANYGFTITQNATADTIAYRTIGGVMAVGTPTASGHATTKAYVDTADALKVNKAGDTMTGILESSVNSPAFAHVRGGRRIQWGLDGNTNMSFYNTTDSVAVTTFKNDGTAIYLGNASSAGILRGTGFPEGVVTAPVGSIYIDTAITNGIAIWYKKTGIASTGWVPLSLSSTPPATATSTGISGQTAYDSNYYYICVATNTWKRTPLSSW